MGASWKNEPNIKTLQARLRADFALNIAPKLTRAILDFYETHKRPLASDDVFHSPTAFPSVLATNEFKLSPLLFAVTSSFA